MARRNEVPETVSHETRQAKALQRRRETEATQRRAAEHPVVSIRDSRNVSLSRETLDQLREEVTPTDAAGRAYAQSGNVPMTLLMGGLKAAETYGAAATTSPRGSVRLVSTRNKADGSPVASRPIDATPEQRTAFDAAITARNRDKRVRRSKGSTVVQDSARHDAKVATRERSLMEQFRAPEALRDLLGKTPSRQVSPGLIEVPVNSYNLADVIGYVQRAIPRTDSRSPAPWCVLASPDTPSYPTYSAVPQAMYVNARTGKPVAYRASDLFSDISLKKGIPLFYDMMDDAHRTLHDALDPKNSRTRVLDTPDPDGSVTWKPTTANEAMIALDKLGEPVDAPYRQRLIKVLKEVSPEDPIDPRYLLDTHQDAKGGNTRADAKGGDASGPSEDLSPEPGGTSVSSPAGGGPRIVVNPSTFRNEKDALCVAFNEAFRVVMEDLEFEPQSEPTDEQRRFFSDTAYADDELQLRRTILARICTFDTSVEDPTDEQLQEAVEFLETVQEAGAPQNEWEQKAVQRLRDMVAKVLEDGEGNASAPPPPPQGGSVQADEGGGVVQQDDEERRRREAEEAARAEEEAKAEDAKREAAPPQQPALVPTEPTSRLARDLERIARSSKSDRDTFMLENMQESGRYSADGSDVPVSGVDALGLARTQPLTEDRQAIENAESARTEDYLARKREDEQREADNHYTSDYVQNHDIGVAARKNAAAGRKTARNRWKDQEEEERRRNRGLGA